MTSGFASRNRADDLTLLYPQHVRAAPAGSVSCVAKVLTFATHRPPLKSKGNFLSQNSLAKVRVSRLIFATVFARQQAANLCGNEHSFTLLSSGLLALMKIDRERVPWGCDGELPEYAAYFATVIASVQGNMGEHFLAGHIALVAIGEGEGHCLGECRGWDWVTRRSGRSELSSRAKRSKLCVKNSNLLPCPYMRCGKRIGTRQRRSESSSSRGSEPRPQRRDRR